MITLQDAELLAGGWAQRQTRLRDAPVTAMVREFDLGFVIWMQAPPSELPEPNDGARTVIDRRSGVISQYPSLPVELVIDLYRQRADGPSAPPSTVDQLAQLRRSARRLPAPTIAAHLTLVRDRVLRRSFGAKGDQQLNHHHLVRAWLAGHDPGELVRGVERHAELIAISDVLHGHDAAAAVDGQPSADLTVARELLGSAAVIEFFHVREAADPLGARSATECRSCAEALVHFGLRPHDYLSPPPPAPAPQMRYRIVHWPALTGLPAELATILVRPSDTPASDTPASDTPAPETPASDPPAEQMPVLQADVWDSSLSRRLAVAGHPPLPAARDVFLRYGGLKWDVTGPGDTVAVRPFDISAFPPRCPDTLASFGAALGARLCPIGSEGYDETILAVDEHGRVFSLDQGGEWFVGADIDSAVVNLIFGRQQSRVRDDGTW